MKNMILPFLILLLSSPILSLEEQTQNTTIVFFVRHVDQPLNDLVQISLKIESKDQSLTKSIKKGASSVQEITTYAKDFCEEYSKKKGQCKQIVQADEFQIEPRYQLIRKSPVFMGFTVTNQMTIVVRNVQKIGHLVDKILQKEGVILNDFKWKSSKESKANEQAIAEGMQQGEGLCQQLNLKLGKVISVTQVHASQAQLAQINVQQQEQQEEQQQDSENLTVFKFEVQCEPKNTKKK